MARDVLARLVANHARLLVTLVLFATLVIVAGDPVGAEDDLTTSGGVYIGP